MEETKVKVILKNGFYTVIDRNEDWTFKKRLRFSINEISNILAIFTFEQLEWLKKTISHWEENQIDYINENMEDISTNNDNLDLDNVYDNSEYDLDNDIKRDTLLDFIKQQFNISKTTKISFLIMIILFILIWLWLLIFSSNPANASEWINTNNNDLFTQIEKLELEKNDLEFKHNKDIIKINLQIDKLTSQIYKNNTVETIKSTQDKLIKKIEEIKNK